MKVNELVDLLLDYGSHLDVVIEDHVYEKWEVYGVATGQVDGEAVVVIQAEVRIEE